MSVTAQEVTEVRDWLASYGPDPAGGMTRRLYTTEWLDAQMALKKRFEDLGMTAEFDEVGNLYGILEGTDEPDAAIATGSHVDTVVQGGKLDGALGIFCGYLAVKDLLNTYGAPRKTLMVVSMAEEEGSRFPFAFWGSKNLVGTVPLDEIAGLEDDNGVSFADAMASCGFGPRTKSTSPADRIKTFIELHIE